MKKNIYNILGAYEEHLIKKAETGEKPTSEEMQTLALIGVMKRINGLFYAIKDGAGEERKKGWMLIILILTQIFLFNSGKNE